MGASAGGATACVAGQRGVATVVVGQATRAGERASGRHAPSPRRSARGRVVSDGARDGGRVSWRRGQCCGAGGDEPVGWEQW